MPTSTVVLLCAGLCLVGALPAWAQSAPALPREALSTFYGGLGIGNGLAAEAGQLWPRAVLLGRVRYKYWVPNSIRQHTKLFDGFNTRSRQTECAVLGGYPLPLGRGVLIAATGVAYVSGRQLGDYRYTRKGFFSDSHVFSYRRYQALGLPVQLSWMGLTRRLGQAHPLQIGVSAQADFNPAQTEFCLLLTLTMCSRVITFSQP